jgi:hypothetical protein
MKGSDWPWDGRSSEENTVTQSKKTKVSCQVSFGSRGAT